MVLPKNVKPEDVIGPTGIYYRNPTHVEAAEMADDQSDIVKAILGSGRERKIDTFEYTEETKPWILPGFAFIREMDEKSILELCKTLMRFKPNIYKVHLKLGDYPSARTVNNTKTVKLDSFKPRFHTEVAEKMAEILSDQTMNVVEILYVVHNVEPGHFRASGTVYVTTEKEYKNNELFKPTLAIEYFPNH